MKNNRMRFGDIIVQQLKGIAMGMSPVPAIANLFVAIYETEDIIPTFKKYLPLYLRFIDDGLAVWEHHNNPSLDKEVLQAFKVAINNSGLKWTFTTLSNGVEFVDLTITLKEGTFITNLYEKPLALHLYIPSHSCRPPGCFSGLVAGMVLRIYCLCSLYCHIRGWLKDFMATSLTEVTHMPP